MLIIHSSFISTKFEHGEWYLYLGSTKIEAYLFEILKNLVIFSLKRLCDNKNSPKIMGPDVADK